MTEYVFNYKCYPFMAKGHLHAITGIAGSGMSTLGLALIKVCVNSFLGDVTTPDFKPLKVLWIDNCQGFKHLKQKFDWLIEHSELKHLKPREIDERISAIAFQIDYTASERRAMIEEEIKSLEPDFVFIDDIEELVSCINKRKESSDTVDWLAGLAQKHNCAICCSCHLNKNAKCSCGVYNYRDMEWYVGKALASKARDIFQLRYRNNRDVYVNHIKHTDAERIPSFYLKIYHGKNWDISLSDD